LKIKLKSDEETYSHYIIADFFVLLRHPWAPGDLGQAAGARGQDTEAGRDVQQVE
jgi:hypothetical protein